MVLRIIILSLIGYVFFIIPEKFLNLNYFKINKINLVNSSKMLQSELTNLTKKIYNKKNTEIDYKLLEEFYKKDLRVKKFKINDLALGEIQITTETEELNYYTIINNKVFLLNGEGENFGYLNEKERKFLPFVMGDSKEERLILINILKKINDLELTKYISQIFKVSQEEYIIILLDGIKFKIDLNTSKEKYKIAEMLYFDVKENKKIEYIDLRFDDYIIKYSGDEG